MTNLPRKSGLPREVFKWLHSLNLTFPIHNIRRDFSNGYLTAEILSRYFPAEVEMHMFYTGISTSTKLTNWSLIQRFLMKKKREQQESEQEQKRTDFPINFDVSIPVEIINGTIHMKIGSAELLVAILYSLLTNKILHGFDPSYLSDAASNHFNDAEYQMSLPMHAKTIATKAVKNNFTASENVTDLDLYLEKKKVSENINSINSNLTNLCNNLNKNIDDNLTKIRNKEDFDSRPTTNCTENSFAADHQHFYENDNFSGTRIVCPQSCSRILKYLNETGDCGNRIFCYGRYGEVEYFNQVLCLFCISVILFIEVIKFSKLILYHLTTSSPRKNQNFNHSFFFYYRPKISSPNTKSTKNSTNNKIQKDSKSDLL